MTTWDNSYARLPERFFARQPPTPVRDPQALAFNAALGARLGVEDRAPQSGAATASPRAPSRLRKPMPAISSAAGRRNWATGGRCCWAR